MLILFIIWDPLMNADRVLHTYILVQLYLFVSESEGSMRVLSKGESIDAVLFNGVILRSLSGRSAHVLVTS